MFWKKTLISALAAVCALSLLTPAAFAHGCHRGAQQAQPVRYSVCTVEGCTLAGRHVHDGVTYCGSNHAGGVCDGTCLPLCEVEGCTLTGRHVHDGVTYCGNDHQCGFCDGSCPVYQAPAYSGGCHGGHCRGWRR